MGIDADGAGARKVVGSGVTVGFVYVSETGLIIAAPGIGAAVDAAGGAFPLPFGRQLNGEIQFGGQPGAKSHGFVPTHPFAGKV